MSRMILLSDLHLSPTHGFFWENFCIARDAVNALAPEMTVVSGDLCINGPESDAEMDFAARALASLQGTVLALPGNHDVGDEPPGQDPDQIIDAARLARWNGAFGSDRFAASCGVWRVIGLNAQLLGSGLDAEVAQHEWLAHELMLAADMPVALVLHKPLFLHNPDETGLTVASTKPEPRARMLSLLARHNVRLVISGHLHVHHRFARDGIDYIWAPSLAFVHKSKAPGERIIAGMSFDFSTPRPVITLLQPPGMTTFDLDELKGHGKYPFLRDMPPCPPDVGRI